MWRHREIELSLLTCVVFLATGISSSLLVEELTLQVNTRKPLSVSGDKFLSLAIDPLVILTSKDIAENYERSVKLAEALSPAYLRLGGPLSNVYLLGDDHNGTSYVFSEENWTRLHRWAARTGLDVIACISARFMENDNKVDLVSLTDRMGFNASWQLGYECQTRCDLAGSDVGKYVRVLRDKLDTIPRYSNSIITGPDAVAYGTKEQREYLEDFFSEADDALTAVTWHPDFAGVTRNDGGVFMHHDRLSSEKNDLYRVIGRDAARKPLWIAESRPEASKNQFLGALVWTSRLGNAAKLGAQVLMRQPSDLAKPTPDYWVSLLHKNLVGREVFDAKIQTGNRSHVHFYVQCTKASAAYERGALTIFGVNLTPTKVRANVRGLKLRTLHEYVLMPGFDASNRMFAESVLLNGKPLNLINDTELPDMEAVTLNDEKGLSIELPSGGIGFWVVPDQKMRSCMDHHDEKEGDKGLSADDPVVQKTSQKEEKEIEDNEIRQRRRLIDHQKTIVRQENKRRRNAEKREGEAGERKLRKIDTQKELEKLGKILKRRYARRESKKSTSSGESLDLFDFHLKNEHSGDEVKMESTEKRSKRDLDKFLAESRKTDRKHKRKDDTRKTEQPWTILGSKKGDSAENSFYGFFRQEPIKNFPEGDVFLATGDSKEEEEKDYDYVKDEDEVKREEEEEEKMRQPQAMRIRTIDHAEPDDTWVDVGDDYRGYMPNEFFETINVPNMGERKETVNDYADIWEAENVQKHSVAEENGKKEAAQGRGGTNQENGLSIAEERRIKENSVNMLMNHYSDSTLGESNQEDLEESPRGKTQGARDSILDKTKLTLHGRRRAKTSPVEDDELFSKLIGASAPMQIPTYGDSSKHARRPKRKIKDLNAILEREMIDEDNGNSKDCRCRVIRKLKDDSELGYRRTKRSVNENEEELVEFPEGTDEPEPEQSFDRDDDREIDETTIVSEINEPSQSHQDVSEPNDSKITESELLLNTDDEFFREQRDQPEETTTTTDLDEDLNRDTSRVSQDTASETQENDSTTISSAIVPQKRETSEIASRENSETSSGDKKEGEGPTKSVDKNEAKIALKREIPSSKITKRSENDRPSKSLGSPKASKKFLPNISTSSKTKTQSNPKASEASTGFAESRVTSRSEALSTLKRENEDRRKNVAGSISSERYRDHRRDRTEKLEMLRRRLLAKREEILRQYEDELLDAMKRSGINDEDDGLGEEEKRRRKNKNRRNLKREIWEKLRSTDEYRDMLDREKVAYVLTYGPINYDLLEKREKERKEMEKPVKEEREYIPVVEITRPVYRVDEKLIDEPAKTHRYLQDPRVMLYAKPDGSNSRVIQSRFPYDIIGERERYSSDQVASGKRYYALVDSAEEDPWMFQYQRRSKENQRNVYESTGRREKQPDDSVRTYGTPVRYIYEESDETIDSDESSNSRSGERKIYAIDPSTYKGGEPELEIHEDSGETSVNDDDYYNNNDNKEPVSKHEIYGVILKPNTDDISRNDQSQKNAPILYILDAKRQNDPKKQSSVSTYLLDRRHANDDVENKSSMESNSTTSEQDVTESVEKLETKGNVTAEKLESIEEKSDIDSNEEKENVGHGRTRRDIEGTDSGLFKKIPLFFMHKEPYEEPRKTRLERHDYSILDDDRDIERSAQNSERFSKLLKRLDSLESVQYNPNKNSPLTFDRFFSRNQQFDDFNDDLSKNVLFLSDNSEHDLYNDNKRYEPQDVSTTNEREVDATSEIRSIEFGTKSSEDEKNREIEKTAKFNVNQSGRRWLKLLPITMEKYKRERRQLEDPLNWNDNELRSQYRYDVYQTKSKLKNKNPKLNSKQVYTYVKEDGDNKLNNLVDLNKETDKPKEFWEFKPLSLPEEENYVDNVLEDFTQHDFVIKNDDRKDGPDGNNKSSSFLQGALPKLQEVITEGFDKAQNLTESLEQFVESFDKKFNETLQGNNKNGTLEKNATSSATHDIFRTMITNVKKFFAFLGGITRIFYA
ncbi:hypothetical protein KPH14_001046 [Odynerus spinipes]|uniref:Heparanase n=1 Tax=Odynerus spinipes TaxID=1348599 RepID=A0AAD9R953_9HYME|nr:hypothetical protein KPH14_001046 [Odynerus spinipes]